MAENGEDWAEDLPDDRIDAVIEGEDEIWRALVELAPDGVFLETTEGEILWANDAGAEMFGYHSPDEMVGLGIADLVPDDFAASLPEEITRVTGPRAVRRFNKRKDGTVFPTEIATRFIEMDGEKRLLAYVRDISEHVDAVRELEAALDKVHVLFGIVPICMGCGSVRDDTGYWQRVEDFVAEHAGTRFSHGLCPTCMVELYPDYAEETGATD
ncbi:MAG: PAS domain S-box protein [Longimicrobiales bacterium]